VTVDKRAIAIAARYEASRAAEFEARLRSALADWPDLLWAYLFGSAVRGEDFADLDVGVMLRPEARGGVVFGRLYNRLSEAVPGVRIDLVDLASAAPALIGRIVRERHLLADREPEARKDWEAESNSRALDIEPWLAEGERLRNEALRRKAGKW
jgi:predicted nucleotidyltransferase